MTPIFMQLALGSLVPYEYGQPQGACVLTVGRDPVTYRGGPGVVLGIDDHDQGKAFRAGSGYGASVGQLQRLKGLGLPLRVRA